jgi:lipoyl(octanoyl) transferase
MEIKISHEPVAYKNAMDFLEQRVEKVHANLEEELIWILEHDSVYTKGISASNKDLLEPNLFPVVETNRGGKFTYHGPGQLVGYPILDLDHFFTDIHRYLRYLEEAIILTLAEYGVPAGRIDGLTGVWLDYDTGKNPRKICALGVKSSRWVTMHGFAFNVNVDLSYFGHIVPCGIDDKAVTSLHLELGRPVAVAEVKEKVKKHLAALFGINLIESE